MLYCYEKKIPKGYKMRLKIIRWVLFNNDDGFAISKFK
jgi:hypothetical protein